jgi:preprotein translocase subunit SecF
MIKFMNYRRVYAVISSILLVISITSISIWGLKPAIDFTGGALLEVGFTPGESEESKLPASSEQIIAAVSEINEVEVSSIQTEQDESNYIIRTNSIDEAQKSEILAKLSERFSQPEELRFESVGPTLGRELLIKTGIAVLIASILIMSYVTYQFSDKVYGLSAILAMLHDSIILFGVFSLLGHFYNVEVDILFVTAVLTTLSFSVHDTIVVFDRIREALKNKPHANFEDLVNKAVTETMPRSLNNSMTIIFMLTALTLLGGVTIRWFVFALLVGTVAGTYSSPFVASPLLLWFMQRKKK